MKGKTTPKIFNILAELLGLVWFGLWKIPLKTLLITLYYPFRRFAIYFALIGIVLISVLAPQGSLATSATTITKTSTADWDLGSNSSLNTTSDEVKIDPNAKYAWHNDSWLYRKKITIDHTLVSTENQTDFPVLINLATDADLAARAQDDGDDILITSDDEKTKLSHEIESFDGDTGQLVLWVKVPSLSYLYDTTLYLYYGNGDAASQQNATDVWSNGYVGVWHLKDGTTLTTTDSVGNFNLTNSGTVAAAASAKINGGATSFSPDQALTSTGGAALNTTDWTAQGWVYRTATPSYANSILGHTQTTASAGHWFFYSNASNKLTIDIPYVKGDVVHGATTVALNQWSYAVATKSGNDYKVYYNGQSDGSVTDATAPTVSGSVYAGNTSNLNQAMQNSLDELRISNTARSAGWIATEYNNQNSPSTFYALASETAKTSIRTTTTSNKWYTVGATEQTAWKYRRQITIDNAYVPNTDQTEFPMLVKIADSTDPIFTKAQADGDDILFTDRYSNYKLSHEIETFDTSTKELWAWVKIPTLTTAADTNIWLYYGNADATSQQNATDVWSNGYVGVWHMGEASGTTAVSDSTSYNDDATSTSSTNVTTGKISNSRSFNGSSDSLDTAANTNLDTTDTTLSAWIYASWDASPGYNPTILASRDAGSTRYSLHIGCLTQASTTEINLWTTTNSCNTSTAFSKSAWHLLEVKISGGTMTSYIDGAVFGTPVAASFAAVTNRPFHIGSSTGSAERWVGNIDDVKISSTARSADWIATEYNNQNSPETFMSIAKEVGYYPVSSTTGWYATGGTWSARQKITIDNAKVPNTDQTDFPVLIKITNQSNGLFGTAQADGDDILFTSDNGTTKLSHEIETYDGATAGSKALWAWVKVPTLATATDTVLYMYYGEDDITSQQNATDVWSNGFFARYDMADASGALTDSKGSYSTTTQSNFTYNQAGKTGKAVSLTNGSTTSEGPSMTQFDNANKISMSYWVNYDQYSQPGRIFQQVGSPGVWMLWQRMDGTALQLKVEGASAGSGWIDVSTFTVGQWAYVDWIYDGTGATNADRLKLYINGSPVALNDLSSIPTSIGNTAGAASSISGNNAQSMDGFLDELRLASSARSADWIATEYNNQNDPDSFYSLSIEQSAASYASPTSTGGGSGIIDTIWNGGWGTPNGFASTVTVPSNTSILFQMRSSSVGGSSNDDWTAWADLGTASTTGTFSVATASMPVGITTGANRYLQTRALLASDIGDATPTLSDFSIYYEAEKTVTEAGGNWSSASTWSDGVVPTSADDVYFVAGSGNVTIDAAAAVRSVTTSGYTGTLTHNASVTLSVGDASGGALDFTGAWTYTLGSATTSSISFVSTSDNGTAGWPITWGGKTPGNITYNGAGGKWVYQDGYTATSQVLTLTAGELDVNAQTISFGTFSPAQSADAILTLTGNTNLTVNSWNSNNLFSWVLNAGTSTITFTGGTFSTGSKTYYTVVFTGSGNQAVRTSATFTNLTRTGTAAKTDIFTIRENQTITGTLTLTGNSTTNRLLVQSYTLGTARTITAAAVDIDNVDFMDITAAGAASPFTGVSLGDAGGNTNITTDAPVAQTWTNAAGGNWSDAGNWTSRVPLPQDDVSMNRAGGYNSGVTVTADMPRLGKSIDWTGATWTGTATRWTLGSSNTSYGSITLISGMNFTTGTAYILSGRSSFTLTTSGKSFNYFTIQAPGGTYTLGDAFSASFFYVYYGSFITAGNSVAAGYHFESSGSGTRTVNISNSEITVGSYGEWIISGTGLTITAPGSTIIINPTVTQAGNFTGGSYTYNNIQIAPGSGALTFSGAFTFNNMTMSSAGTKTVKFTKATTYTMTGDTFLSGTSGNLITLDTNDSTGQFTLSKASGTMVANYLNISRSNVTGGASWYMADTTTDGGGNTGWLTDAVDPTNPAVSALTVNGGAVTDGTWTSSEGAVSITYSGAADADSGLLGYYTYFGTNASADPSDYVAHSGAIGDDQTFSSSYTTAADGNYYYFRVKTKDAVGNISDAATLFDFGYDNTIPTRPTYIAASPAGYTTTNSFTFTWPAGTDPDGANGASGIKWYQYKTATAGSWSNTADASTRTATGVEAYQEGANAFYVRTVDLAGNPSSNYQQTTFYYSGVAPSAPTGLTATPNTSATNSFTFSWTKPTVGAGDPPVKGYYYTINEVPTMTNLTYLASTANSVSLGPDAYATQQGLNTFYVLAVNDAGNYSLDEANYASVGFTTQTTAPPIPAQVSLTDSSDSDLSRWMLTLQWTAGSGQDANTFDHYIIYRSTNGVGFTELATTTSTAYIDTGLTNTTTYYYNIKAVDNAGKESAQSTTVSKIPTGKYLTPPSYLSTPTVSSIKSNSSKIAWITDRSSTSIVRYGKATDDLDASSGQMDSESNHEVDLSGLDPGATYYYQVQSLDENRDYSASDAYSTTYSFSTLAAPTISNVQVDNITLTSADVTWDTTTVSTSSLQYGVNSQFDKKVDDISGANATNHSVKLSDLTHSTKYAFKLTATDIDGNQLTSDNYNFETLPMPKIENLKATLQNGSRARPAMKITWTTNVATSSIVKYSISGSNQAPKEETTAKLKTDHEVTIEDLSDQATYKIQVTGRDSLGNLADESTTTLTTPNDTRPPVISNIVTETSNVGLNKRDKAQIVVSWSTDEPSTSRVEYGKGLTGDNYEKQTAEDGTLSGEHVVIISDLEPSIPYHIRVSSKDNAGNSASSEDQTIISAETQKSLLSILMETFKNVFGWMGKMI